MLGIRFPVIMAPMFLVSNAAMLIEAIRAGIAGTVPALNYRTDKEFRAAMDRIRAEAGGPFGVNLIVNKSNIRLQEQLKTCVDYKVDFIITSLGSPAEVIREAHNVGTRVFCDVVDDGYARKVEELGADALIAVNNRAGGHAGNLPPEQLIPALLKACSLPVISAGGVGNAAGLKEMLALGACGVSVGSPFIATVEAPVSEEYKQACVDFGANDIVMTNRLSGTPCTVINTDYVKETGTELSWIESLLLKNKSLKKLAKMLTAYKGMKALKKAAFSATYKTLWCAGPSIAYTKKIETVSDVVNRLVTETAN